MSESEYMLRRREAQEAEIGRLRGMEYGNETEVRNMMERLFGGRGGKTAAYRALYGGRTEPWGEMRESEQRVGEVKAMVEGAKEIGEEARVGTLQIVRESVEPVDVDVSKLEHFQKLAKVTDSKAAGLGGMTYGQIAKLKAMGFGVFVRVEKFVPRFRYAASVRREGAVQDRNSRSSVVYTGDIPDSVLDKAYKVVYDVGIGFITIHSHQPFPIELKPCDPVLVGWAQNPGISCDLEGREKCRFEGGNTLGVIIAVWDMEKEEQL